MQNLSFDYITLGIANQNICTQYFLSFKNSKGRTSEELNLFDVDFGLLVVVGHFQLKLKVVAVLDVTHDLLMRHSRVPCRTYLCCEVNGQSV